MVYTIYLYSNFDAIKARAGSLCLMIKDGYTPPIGANSIANMVVHHNEETGVDTPVPNQYFKGAGVCDFTQANFIFTIDSISYTFNEKGLPVNLNAKGWKLYIGQIGSNERPQDVGNAIDTNYKASTTRGATDIITTYDFGQGGTVMVDQLNARDAFAMQALQGIMEHINKPDGVSDSEMNFYTAMAYKWAANMMMAAAKARSELKDGEGGETPQEQDTETVTVGALEGNTEKLLNNIVAALEKTDEKEGTGDNVKYSERVSIPKLIEFLNNYVTHTEEPEEGSEDEPVTTKYGLYDLIQAIKDIDAGGGGGTTEIDFTDLINALNSMSTSRTVTSFPDINIGNSGLGRDNDHPIYISGGGFPSRDVLAAAFTEANIHDFLTFNAAGAVGYSTKDEVKKAILGYLNNYSTLAALSTAVLGELTADAIYNKIQSKVDDRIKAWLQAARDAEGRPLTVNIPT